MMDMADIIRLERYVLGCLMIDKQHEVDKVKTYYFADSMSKSIFDAIWSLSMTKREIDIISVSEIAKIDTEDAFVTVARIASEVDTTSRFNNALLRLKKYSLKREIGEIAHLLIELIENESGDIVTLRNDAMQLMNLRIETENDSKTMKDNVKLMMKDIKKQRESKDSKKLFTGFVDVDKTLAGFHPEELTILAARPAVGKTAFAIQLMIQLAHKNNYCYFISREMSELQLTKRMASNVAGINGSKFRLAKNFTEEELIRLGQANEILSWLNIAIDDQTATIQDIRANCRELYNSKKLNVLIVDYLQLLRSSGKHQGRREEIEYISRGLKEISMEFNIPVIALSQLSRASTDEKEPALHHLRESGSLEQDADNVIFLHQDKNEDGSKREQLKLIIAKQRNGSTGYIHLNYHANTLKFTSK